MYFAVSKRKLGVMSVCTFGLYQLYWFYMNWKLVREREELDISPFGRAMFSVFFCYSLFERVKDSAAVYQTPSRYSSGWLTFAYIVLLILGSPSSPLGFLAFLSFLPLLPVQEVVNSVNAKAAPNAGPNDRFTVTNIIIIILFVAFLTSVCLWIAGLFTQQ